MGPLKEVRVSPGEGSWGPPGLAGRGSAFFLLPGHLSSLTKMNLNILTYLKVILTRIFVKVSPDLQAISLISTFFRFPVPSF